MGKLVWKGWQKSAENAPQPTSVIYGANLRSEFRTEAEASGGQSAETDFVLALLRRANLPLTRKNYLGLAYPDGLPEDLKESSFPLKSESDSGLRKCIINHLNELCGLNGERTS